MPKQEFDNWDLWAGALCFLSFMLFVFFTSCTCINFCCVKEDDELTKMEIKHVFHSLITMFFAKTGGVKGKLEPPTNVLVHFIECQQARRGDALRRRCAPYAPYMPHTGVLSLYPIHRRVLRRPSIMRMRAGPVRPKWKPYIRRPLYFACKWAGLRVSSGNISVFDGFSRLFWKIQEFPESLEIFKFCLFFKFTNSSVSRAFFRSMPSKITSISKNFVICYFSLGCGASNSPTIGTTLAERSSEETPGTSDGLNNWLICFTIFKKSFEYLLKKVDNDNTSTVSQDALKNRSLFSLSN
ncbi:Protein CBG10081 [Caenorhabditis briggsae]|uniref:Protein CBG10081 n=1 Tax=Caenorhabditis briggsae TaxID=6238 RepID=A8XAC3_CAEBR|nr:Protein CBG10081 [Caenorhabditis briggsae]CAP29591.1 Protein CBG10081 [Caenorhabditis briggsae]